MSSISADQVKLIRMALGLSKIELSAMLDVSISVIMKYESKQRNSKLLPERIQSIISEDIIYVSQELLTLAQEFKTRKKEQLNDEESHY